MATWIYLVFPHKSAIATYSVSHIGALLMIVGLLRIGTGQHWYAFQEGRQHWRQRNVCVHRLASRQFIHPRMTWKFLSVGITVLESGELDFTSAMNKADQAMYQAKNEGRNRVVLAD